MKARTKNLIRAGLMVMALEAGGMMVTTDTGVGMSCAAAQQTNKDGYVVKATPVQPQTKVDLAKLTIPQSVSTADPQAMPKRSRSINI